MQRRFKVNWSVRVPFEGNFTGGSTKGPSRIEVVGALRMGSFRGAMLRIVSSDLL